MSLNLSNHKRYFSAYILPTTAAGGAMFCTPNAAAFREVLPEAPVTTDRRSQCEEEKLFEKPLTPSDVGKLNRLVIPKQHAEKYFPLNGGGVDSGELLGFEDECGKAWRFRYSYWNSSQSYVLTKGWSRFVKEKRLGAGDVVQFARHRRDIGRFFIGWRRRNSDGGGGGRPYLNGQGAGSLAYQTHHQYCSTTTTAVEKINGRGGVGDEAITRRNGNSKRMRLFGVNLECPEDESDAAETSSQGESTQHHSFTDHQRTWI